MIEFQVYVARPRQHRFLILTELSDSVHGKKGSRFQQIPRQSSYDESSDSQLVRPSPPTYASQQVHFNCLVI